MFSEPLGLECLAALLKDKHEVKILDLMVGKEDYCQELIEFRPQIVGFTSLCIDVWGVRDLARKTKSHNKEIITLVGGLRLIYDRKTFSVRILIMLLNIPPRIILLN